MSATSANASPRVTGVPTWNPGRSHTCQYWVITTPWVVACRMSTPPRKVGSTEYPAMTPSPAAITGWISLWTSIPVCSQTAPDGHARSTVPLQMRHSLPKPRQSGCQVGSGYWKTSAELTGGGGGGISSGAAPGGPGRTSRDRTPTSSRRERIPPIYQATPVGHPTWPVGRIHYGRPKRPSVTDVVRSVYSIDPIPGRESRPSNPAELMQEVAESRAAVERADEMEPRGSSHTTRALPMGSGGLAREVGRRV